MTVLFFLFGFKNVEKYVYSLTQNYLAFLSNSGKKKVFIPPKKNIGNNKRLERKSDKKVNKKGKNILVSATNSETDLKNVNRRKSKLNPVDLPNFAKDDLIITFKEQNKTIQVLLDYIAISKMFNIVI